MDDLTKQNNSEKQPNIFLKEAVDEQFSFSRLDQILVVIHRKEWMTYIAIIIVIFLFFLWCFFGSIPITTSGKGIIIDEHQMTSVLSQTEGIVQKVNIKQGDYVETGQLLVELHNPSVIFEYEYYQKRYANVKREYELLVEQVNREQVFRLSYLREQATSLQSVLDNKTKEIEILKSTLETEESLLQKNLLALPTVNRTRIDLLLASSELENTEAKIKEIAFEQAKNYRQSEIWEKEALFSEVIRALGVADIRRRETLVQAPESGQVISFLTSQGLAVTKGSPLVILQKSTDTSPPRFFYAYIPATEAKGIRVGMPARVELSKYILKKYGFILGKVKEVSVLPISDMNILANLFNPDLIHSLAETSVGQVIVELDLDPHTSTGYRWSSGSGPQDRITIGNIGVVHIVVDRIAPIYFLIPNWIKNEDMANEKH